MDNLINNLRNNKPRTITIDPKVTELMNNSDALSGTYDIFKYRGDIGGRKAIPFVELTPELLAFFKELYS